MSMERNIITMSESGSLILPEDIAGIWMGELELVELFGIIVPALRAAIRAVYKSGVLYEHEVQKYVRLENGYHADVFSFPIRAALAFRINSSGAEQVRKILFERLYLRKEKTNIFFSLGVNSMEAPKYQV